MAIMLLSRRRLYPPTRNQGELLKSGFAVIGVVNIAHETASLKPPGNANERLDL